MVQVKKKMIQIQMHSLFLMDRHDFACWKEMFFFIRVIAEIIDKLTWPQVMTLRIVHYQKRFCLKIYRLSVPTLILSSWDNTIPPSTLRAMQWELPSAQRCYWLTNPGRDFLKESPGLSISLCSVWCPGFFLEIELPLTSNRIYLKVQRNHRTGSVVPLPPQSQLRCSHWRANWVKCPLPSEPENSPTKGLSCTRPQTKGRPQSLAYF